MRRYLTPLFFLLLCVGHAAADTFVIKEAKGRQSHFTSAPEAKGAARSGTKESVFYRKGIVSEAAKVVTTGYLRVRLSGVMPETFAALHGLKYVYSIDTGLYLFKNSTPRNDMAVAADLAKDAGVVSAVPQFKSRKSLK